MLAAQMGWWENICQATNKKNDGQITIEEWHAFWAGWLTTIANEAGSNQSPALDAMKNSASVTFDMIDTNGDGHITAGEYADWCYAMSMNFDARRNFQRLDVSKTGRMSRAETVERLKEYFLTNDPEAPGNYLYGPLL
jgi:juvenile hormone diol kinase